jgi:hypothetical protein
MPMSDEPERKWGVRRFDKTWAPVLEGALILLMGGISLAFGRPLLFAGLGPTAYEQVEKPELPSSHLYNVIVGHWIATACGFAALAITGAWFAPNPLTTGRFTAVRVWACVLAVVLTVFFTLLLKATQPAALSTALIVAIGSLQRPSDAWAIAISVAILGVVGEPIRRMRLSPSQQAKEEERPEKLAA